MEPDTRFFGSKPFTLEEWLKDKTQVCLNSNGEVLDVNMLSVGYLTDPENTKHLYLKPADLTPFEQLVEKKLSDYADFCAKNGKIPAYGMNLQNKRIREISNEILNAAFFELRSKGKF